MSRITGSYEELTSKLADAVRAVFPKEKRHGEMQHPWVWIQATFPDHVIVEKDCDSSPAEQYLIRYTWDDDGAPQFGEPDRVRTRVVVEDVEDGEKSDGDEEAVAVATRILPAVARVAVATRLVSGSPEVKDADALGALQGAALELLDALAVKGVDMRDALGLSDPDEDALAGDPALDPETLDDLTDEDDPVEGKGDAIPGGEDGDLLADDDEGYEVKADGRPVLTPAMVAAQLAELNA